MKSHTAVAISKTIFAALLLSLLPIIGTAKPTASAAKTRPRPLNTRITPVRRVVAAGVCVCVGPRGVGSGPPTSYPNAEGRPSGHPPTDRPAVPPQKGVYAAGHLPRTAAAAQASASVSPPPAAAAGLPPGARRRAPATPDDGGGGGGNRCPRAAPSRGAAGRPRARPGR